MYYKYMEGQMNEEESRKKLLYEMLGKAIAVQLHQEKLLDTVIDNKLLRNHIQELINAAQQIGQMEVAYMHLFGERLNYDNLQTKSTNTILNLDNILKEMYKNKENILKWKIPKDKENRRD
jgi:hypothetical protein